MLKLLVCLCLTTIISCSADDIFKNCSSVEFCANLRNAVPEVKYTVDFQSIKAHGEDGFVEFTLIPSDKSSNLTVIISILSNESIRIQIENDSERYKLKDVLIEEPKTISFIAGFNQEKLLIVPLSNDIDVSVTYSPFTIQLTKHDITQVILNGDQLVFENSESSQAFAFSVSFPEAIQLYGIPQHADNLPLQSTRTGGTDPYRLRNVDMPYGLYSTMALYGAVPVLYGHGTTSTSGIFLHNAAQQWIDVSNGQNSTEAHVMVQGGSLDLFLFPGTTPVEVVRQYTALTGTSHLPQLWTLGYHQCRLSYESQEDVKEVVANFNKFDFGLDSIWLDIGYTNEERYFTWDYNNFSDPVEMQTNISALHKKLVTIIDPHIKVEEGYSVYDGALSGDFFIKNANNSVFEGMCWPGLSSYIDFLDPEARSYYASFYSYEKFPDTTPVLAGIWNDMNEPSVFDDTTEKTIRDTALHIDEVHHEDIHNMYGLLHTMSTYQGLLERDNGTKRPFILSRSHFAGSQRYAAIWTGDNTADWGYISISYAQCLNANLVGLVFCGADIGGFFGNPDVELLQRWYQAGAWLPFYRAHADLNTARREPYLFDEDVQSVIRNAIRNRYLHIPTWYTLFHEHSITGDPIIRPLFYNYPEDENTITIDDQLLLGNNILVRPVTEPGVSSVSVYFPGGPEEFWVSQDLDEVDIRRGTGYVDIPVTIDKIPVYYRANSIILLNEGTHGSVEENGADPFNTLLIIIKESDDYAFGNIYIDDYSSFNYRDSSQYLYMTVEYKNRSLVLSILHNSGFNISFKKFSVFTVSDTEESINEGTFYKRTDYSTDHLEEILSIGNLKMNKTITINL